MYWTFFQMAGVLKNLEVTIRNVHIRYEEKQKPNSERHSFASGVTLKSISMTTTSALEEGSSSKLMVKYKFVDAHMGVGDNVGWRG